MMFKRLRITGRNKIRHGIAALMAAVLLMGIPVSAAKPEDFTDLQDKQNEWYMTNGELPKAIELGLFGGQGANYFGVDEEITRAEFVTALSRLCGLSEAEVKTYSHDGHFIDVAVGEWHYSYISWAYKEGLVGGTSENEFSPDRSVNRQEMSKMLANAIEFVFEKPLTTEGAAIFNDQELIDDWAIPYVQKCNVAGIFHGDEGNFNPLQYAPRHQAACVFYRCHTMLEEDKQEPDPEEPPATDPETPPATDPETPPATDPETPPSTDPELPPINPADYGLTVSGFDLEFHVDTDYYLAQPADFKNCKLVSYKGFTDFKVSVEQYAGYYPYRKNAYKMGAPLLLGNGRAKIVINATLQNGEEREYLIALTDPDAADYAYAMAKIVTDGQTSVKIYKEPNEKSTAIATVVNNAPRIYYLKTVDKDWCMVEQLSSGKVGYIRGENLRWNWLDTPMPERYKTAIEALKKAHPNWTFTFVDVERDYNTYLEYITNTRAETRAKAEGHKGDALTAKIAEYITLYRPEVETYMDPLFYLNETEIFAMLNIDIYDQQTWNDAGISAIWANEATLKKYPQYADQIISKADAVEAFKAASDSLLMNPYYIACRAAQESGYGSSKFARGAITGYEGYHNFFGIDCIDSNPTKGAAYAKNRNWNSEFRAIVEGANWVKDQYLDRGAITPYFFRYAGFQDKVYMSDLRAPEKEADILARAFKDDPLAKAHFVIPVYRNMPTA